MIIMSNTKNSIFQCQRRTMPLHLRTNCIQILFLFHWFAPIGICFLLAEHIVNMADAAKEFAVLAMFMVTASVGLIIHAFIILPIIYGIFVRKNPYRFALHMIPAVQTALGTSSR